MTYITDKFESKTITAYQTLCRYNLYATHWDKPSSTIDGVKRKKKNAIALAKGTSAAQGTPLPEMYTYWYILSIEHTPGASWEALHPCKIPSL